MAFCAEYIWIDKNDNFRSKIRVVNSLDDITNWNYDGSSTGQANITSSEIILKPCKIFMNPLLKSSYVNYLVVCDTYDLENNPLDNNHRKNANDIFNEKLDEEPWFGLEQEYYMIYNINNDENIIGFDSKYVYGKYYCSPLEQNQICVKIAEEHLFACIEAGIKISGINAEVSPGQWEFQIGPCVGIESGDNMFAARYLLEKIAIKYNVKISYNPKLHPKLSGSGCHVNFSTKNMRNENGLEVIFAAITMLEKSHKIDIKKYGKNNHLRLTGKCETANIDTFSSGIGSRDTSIRIGFDTYNNKKGYFEDRRPAANIDPYLVTSNIFKTCCNNI
jgi:glutamine synthetase